MISQQIDKVALEIEQNKDVTEDVSSEATQTVSKNEPVYYSSVAFLQTPDATQPLDELKDKGAYEGLLREAKEYDQGDSIDLENTNKSPLQYRGDDLLIEDEHHAVVYNNVVGGTYDVMRKVTEQDVRDAITRYGLPDKSSDDIKSLAEEMGITQEEELTERSGIHR